MSSRSRSRSDRWRAVIRSSVEQGRALLSLVLVRMPVDERHAGHRKQEAERECGADATQAGESNHGWTITP